MESTEGKKMKRMSEKEMDSVDRSWHDAHDKQRDATVKFDGREDRKALLRWSRKVRSIMIWDKDCSWINISRSDVLALSPSKVKKVQVVHYLRLDKKLGERTMFIG